MQRATVAQFIAAWHRNHGIIRAVAHDLGISERAIFTKRNQVERSCGIELRTTDTSARSKEFGTTAPIQLDVSIKSGTVLIFSDAHYWPGESTVAHEALLRLCKSLKPVMVIANGDLVDGASISRHDKQGWAKVPTMLEELTACKLRMGEIQRAAGKARLIRTIGNHCIRFERHLAMNVAELEGVDGFRLTDHLKGWEECWSVMANKNVMIKHRYNNGVHAAYNNALKAGLSIFTGHLHRLCVTPWGDYTGRRWGVDTGTLAEPHGPQFTYSENNPNPHCSGFAVATFKDGALMPPELVEVIRGKAIFRGSVV